MQASLPPFHCSYLPAFSELLAQLECSLLISTYQAGKVIAINSDGERICQLPRTFNSPMGLALDKHSLAIATKEEIVLLANSPELAWAYPNKPHCYDSMFVPRGVLFTGQLAVHDLAWLGGSLVGVNTSFSCISKFDHTFSFAPVWKPSFISDLQHEDRCHLNGMAVDDGKIRYATALGATDTAQGWRAGKTSGGVLMDVQANEIILGCLAMPHSPRMVNGQLLLLLSATGEIVRVDANAGRYEVINRVNGFVRGMDCCGDYLFVTTSKLRKTHTFGDLDLARKELFCGVTAIHLPTGSIVAQLRYDNSCEEIYDLKVLPGIRRPNLLRHDQDVHRHAVATPDATFWASPGSAEVRPSPVELSSSISNAQPALC